jgi:hypothetical protein
MDCNLQERKQKIRQLLRALSAGKGKDADSRTARVAANTGVCASLDVVDGQLTSLTTPWPMSPEMERT